VPHLQILCVQFRYTYFSQLLPAITSSEKVLVKGKTAKFFYPRPQNNCDFESFVTDKPGVWWSRLSRQPGLGFQTYWSRPKRWTRTLAHLFYEKGKTANSANFFSRFPFRTFSFLFFLSVLEFLVTYIEF